MNNVNINYSTSGLGTPATGEDFISGLIFYSATIPSGFTNNVPQEILSVTQAESLGVITSSASTYLDVIHYHIAEYFRANPTGDVWVLCVTSAATANGFTEITTVQNAAIGKVRQIGIFDKAAFSASNLSTIQGVINANINNNKPLEVIYQANFSGATLSSLADLQQSNAPDVTVCLGQDGAALGNTLFTNLSYSIGCVGLLLGAVSSALVSTSIAWVQNFNMDAVEMDTLAFANGTLLTTVSDNFIASIDAKNYVFLRKFVGISGSYFNNDYTAISNTSDYSTIHLNRTIHKAAREVRARLLPSLAAPIYFNADGTIALYSIGFFQSECVTALAQMVSNAELSQFKVIINAKQNVLSTKILYITVQLVPVGVADIINVNLGFVLSI